MRLDTIPRVALAHAPTPFHALPRLAADLDLERLWIKRDDCTGLAFGGNKTRKLEFTLADALEKRATLLITTGGVQSNHVRQTAAAAARCGLGCQLVLYSPLDDAPALYRNSGNRLLDEILGAEVHRVADGEAASDAKVEALRAAALEAGERPYIVPLGASDGIGSLGYVACARELFADFARAGIDPSHIFVGTGSAGTHAGLLMGLRILGSRTRVIGISVSEPADIKVGKVEAVLSQLAALLRTENPAATEDVIVSDAYVGAGYGIASAAGDAALRRVAQREGIILDPVYTAKVMAGMIGMLATGSLG